MFLKSLIRGIQFVILYVYAARMWQSEDSKNPPDGIKGVLLTKFLDREHSRRRHSAVAFLLEPGVIPSDFKHDLWGPFGLTSTIDLKGSHLYGCDTWADVKPKHLADNPDIRILSGKYPNWTILLAGVRTFFGIRIPPLNKPENFILVKY